jgi:hypothetical protein
MSRGFLARTLDILDQGDCCHLLLLIGVLYLVGRHMVAQRPRLIAWGLRLGAAAFLAYGISGCARFSPGSAADLWWIAVRGLLAGGLTLGLSWILLPVVAFAYAATIGSAVERSLRSAERARVRAWERQTRHVQQPVPPPVADTKKLDDERRRVEAQRRIALRFEAETFFHRHAAAVRETFPPEAFASYLQKYMSDAEPPDVLEARLKKFQEFILDLAGSAGQSRKAKDPEAVTAWYEGEKARLEARPMKDTDRQTQLARLYTRYAELMDEAMKTVDPS